MKGSSKLCIQLGAESTYGVVQSRAGNGGRAVDTGVSPRGERQGQGTSG